MYFAIRITNTIWIHILHSAIVFNLIKKILFLSHRKPAKLDARDLQARTMSASYTCVCRMQLRGQHGIGIQYTWINQ